MRRQLTLFSSLSKYSTRLRVSPTLLHTKFKKILTVLTQDGFEAQSTKTRSEDTGSGRIEPVLNSNGNRRSNGNDEEPQSGTVSFVPAFCGSRLLEPFDTLCKDDTKGRVDKSGN